MKRLAVTTALALILILQIAAGQNLWVETCSAGSCGNSCFDCPLSTSINNTDTENPAVLCPENGTFCYVSNYWSNGTWTIQNCSGCSNSSNTSCTDCNLMNNSFVQDYCSSNGSCWSINYTNSTNNASWNNRSTLWVETCSASECGNSCFNCSNSTWLNNTNALAPLVLCPENGTFCYVDYYWSNGSWSVQNCSSCANSSNTSCTGCTWVTESFTRDFCALNGTCWSINFTNASNSSNNTHNTSRPVWVETCSASVCGSSCFNCSNSTWINNTNTLAPLVLCPQNGTFCYVDYSWFNNTWALQNCSGCANSSNTSCTDCSWVTNSFQRDFCAANGTCWSIKYNATNSTNSTNNTTNITVTIGTPSIWVESCLASLCGSSCRGCSNVTWINNTNSLVPLVLCPENNTFCFVDNVWSNGTRALQNCSGCANSSNTSCTDCAWITNPFVQDYCSTNGTCWSVEYRNNQTINVTMTTNSSGVNGTNTTTTTVWTDTCRCSNGDTYGTDNNGKLCTCPLGTANTTTYPNGTTVTTVRSPLVNTSMVVSSGRYLEVSLGAIMVALVAIAGSLSL